MKKYLIISVLAMIWFSSCFYLSLDFLTRETRNTWNESISQSNIILQKQDNLDFKNILDKKDDKLCDISEKLSCSLVSNNEKSQLFSIPFSIYGSFMFVIIFLLSIIWFINKKDLFFKMILVISWLAILVNLYLFYLEIFVIKSLCLVCLVCSIMIFSMFFISLKNTRCTTKQ